MSDWANERNMGNPSAVAGHFGDIKENEKAPLFGPTTAASTCTRTGPTNWVVEIHTEDLERWTGGDVSLDAIPGHDDVADLDHVIKTLLPVANFVRAVCGQGKLDAESLENLLLAAAPHRR